MKYRYNPRLPFVLEKYEGNPVSKEGRFFHPQYPFELGWADVVKWKSRPNPYAQAKRNETWRPSVIRDETFLQHNQDVFVWLGHATFFFRLNGRNILVDPVFGPLSLLMPRHSALPVSPDKFNNLDYILLTHDHRDHCDLPSLKTLARNNPTATVLCGLGTAPLLVPLFGEKKITEMGWHQQYHDERAGLAITYLPTRHWCRRFLTDTNRRLWGAFVLQTDSSTLYFGGDSGYGDHYQAAAGLFPNIDYAFLGIGAFAPEWFMQSNHTSPAAAFQAFKDLKAKHFVPMHHGTFDLSDEPLGEPVRLLERIAREEGVKNGEVLFLEIGRNVGGGLFR